MPVQDLDSIWRAHFGNAGFFYTGDGYHDNSYEYTRQQQQQQASSSQRSSQQQREQEETRARWNERFTWQGACACLLGNANGMCES